MADHLEKDILNAEARYTNPAKSNDKKKPKIDLSLGRADWVVGCSAAAARRDTLTYQPTTVALAGFVADPARPTEVSVTEALGPAPKEVLSTAAAAAMEGEDGDGGAGEVSEKLAWSA
jgi:hypothetical protein